MSEIAGIPLPSGMGKGRVEEAGQTSAMPSAPMAAV
jgi:hypothetical protein